MLKWWYINIGVVLRWLWWLKSVRGSFGSKNKLIIFITELVRRYNDNRIAYTSGSMAYFFTLSLFPFIMFLNALIGLVNLDNTTLVALISPFFPAQIVDLLVTYNDYIANISNNYVLIFSIIISLTPPPARSTQSTSQLILYMVSSNAATRCLTFCSRLSLRLQSVSLRLF